MSLLTPLYAIGLLAVSLPILFHLIRRQPRGEFPFSSLMFLSPSPPRLARRSRIDHLLLLLLRGLALALLAFAFARPFLRSEGTPASRNATATRVAILIDTSASMRRGELWQLARAEVDRLMAERQPHDQIAIYACDESLRSIVAFENMAQISPGERRATVRGRLNDEQPTWAATHLGRSLMKAVELVSNAAVVRGDDAPLARRIVLVSDLPEGSRVATLSDYPWPEDVELEIRKLSPALVTNAGLHPVVSAEEARASAKNDDRRVRVSNDAASTAEEFQIQWIGVDDKPVGDPTLAYVPASESRVVRVPSPKSASNPPLRLRLFGDSFDFDNTLFLPARDRSPNTVLYVGDDRIDDPQSLRFYLDRALTEGMARPVVIESAPTGKVLPLQSPAKMPLVVVAGKLTPEEAQALRKYAEEGGRVLLVLKESDNPGAIAELVGAPALDVQEAARSGYTLLGQIDFSHRLFAAMASPQFHDFTQIHFWKYRELKAEQLQDAKLVARFENGDPAIIEWSIGKGGVLVFTSGWHPSDSQLARSWKFVLMISALLNHDTSGSADGVAYTVNQSIPLPESDAAAGPLKITKPDGSVVDIDPTAHSFGGTDQPGLYNITGGDKPQQFAVNLDPLESKTAPLEAESLAQLGCRLVKPVVLAETDKKQRRAQDVQLESRQKMWQWLIVGALGLVVAETWLAGRATRSAIAEGSLA